MKLPFPRLFPLLCLLWLAACAPQAQVTGKADAATDFPIAIDSQTVHLQLALTDSERTRGLMHRDALEPDHGMLFLFGKPAQRGFWMRNTRIPLDLAYFDAEGRLLEIHALYPYDETSVESRSSEILIAVEMNQGWFARNEVRGGARLDLAALAEAVRQRGFDPADFSLQPTR